MSRRVLAFLCAVASAQAAPDFVRDVRPLLEGHCYDCHGDEKKPKGGVNLERFANDAAVMADREIWASVFNKLESHQMPPPKRDSQPSEADRAKLLAWIADMAARPDPKLGVRDPGRAMLRRLTRLEYNNTVRDLFGLRLFQPKSESSTGDIEVDPELMEVFRGFRANTKGDFVIESQNAARPDATYSHYRCEREFTALTKWLRAHGVTGNTPLHTLRKEYGSQMCAKHGIYAASHALRHADIAITSQHYLDKKRRATVGMGHLLARAENVVPLNALASKALAAEKIVRGRGPVKRCR